VLPARAQSVFVIAPTATGADITMRHTILRAGAAATAATLAVTLASTLEAPAAPRQKPNISFFSSARSSAGWAVDDGDQVIRLAADATGYAGADFNNAGGLLATVPAPSFDMKASTSGWSGGSPRLVALLSDGGRVEVRPDTWAGSWETVSSTSDNVDNHGGTCGFRYDTSWSSAIACHPGATVTSVSLITDSGWLAGDHTLLVDDVQWNGDTFGGAASNANS